MIKNSLTGWSKALIVLLSFTWCGASATADEFVPLNGSFDGTGNDFSGVMAHLGSFTGVFDPDTFTAEWTAANGDTVTNQTVVFEFGEEVSDGVFVYCQSIVITGGTGRFEGACGWAEISGLFDLNTGNYCGSVDGEITRPNSQ